MDPPHFSTCWAAKRCASAASSKVAASEAPILEGCNKLGSWRIILQMGWYENNMKSPIYGSLKREHADQHWEKTTNMLGFFVWGHHCKQVNGSVAWFHISNQSAGTNHPSNELVFIWLAGAFHVWNQGMIQIHFITMNHPSNPQQPIHSLLYKQ